MSFSEALEPQSLDLALGIQNDDLPLDSIGVESTKDDEMFIDQTYGLNLQETTKENFGDPGRLNMAISKSSLNPFIIDDSSEENETMPIDGEGPQGTGVNINRIRSAQQILLDGLKNQNSKHGPSSVSEAGNLVNGTGRSGQGWTPASPTSIGDEVDERENIAIYMRHDTTDNSWMERDNNDSKEAEEIERLRKLEASLRRRDARNQLSEMEIYQLRRVTNELKLNKRRKEIAERQEEEPNDAMFVAETVMGGNSNGSGKLNGGPVNYEQPLWVPILHDTIKGKKRRKISRTAREVEEKRREKERGKSRKRRDRLSLLNGSSNKKFVTASKTKKGKSTKKVGKMPREYRSRMKEASGNDALEAMLGSLVYSDPIQERLVQEDFGLAPAIHERGSKKRQMDALMSIIPNDYDIHKSTTQKSDLLRASRSFGYGKVVAFDGKWKLKGMKSSLYHHQLLAAEWMVKRELGSEGPYGGLLADAMGLGKTLEVLAAMVGNPFSEKDAKNTVKGTLLVLPSSAIKQWETEIRLHAENHTFRKVIHYMSRMGIPLWALTEADIVLTSYSEVRNSFPFPSRSELEKCGGFSQWAESYQKSPGVLHQIEWYRIVLDEAHAIKNFKSRTSLACQKLNGKYRWAVSGTPIQNRLEELFSYFRFLRADWASNYLTFRRQYCDPNAEDSRARMAVILSIIMMRRTMKDEILSRPIVELPRTHPSMRFVSFSKEESVIYRTLERHFRECINRHFAQGTAQKSYSMFMVLLLRLRQCTAHPFLLETTVKQILSLGDIVHLKAELKKLSQDKKPFYEQIEQWVSRAQEEQSGVLERVELLEESASFGRSDFGKHFCMDEYFDALHTKEARERVLCGICSDVVVDPQITDCSHVFCENCLMNHMHREVSQEDATDVTTCPTCKRVFSKTSPYTGLSLGTDSDAGFESQSIGPLGKKRSQFDPYPYETTWLSVYKQDKNNYLTPSAKTTAFKALVLRWLSEAPNDKILVFTQFRMMAKLLGLIAEAENWGHVYYTGDMTFTHRHEVVTQFHTDPKVILMIAGLKCGGQALNLTCANRVISIDLWWNHSVEQQAFGRVFRIGQHKETHVTRIIVKNSVDQRLLDMQSEKVRAIDAALQDTGNVLEPLTIEELASLFGHLREGEDGKLRVEEDYDDDEADEGR